MSFSFSQAGQDLFVLSMLKNKKNGTFVEIGSNDPMYINNTFQLELNGWRGLMVEFNKDWEPNYEHCRKSKYLMQDATTINWGDALSSFPENIDYLQIDLEVINRSTIETLENLNMVMDKYKFAVITFEHDIYRGDFFNTRQRSREIFENRGYKCIFRDVKNENNPFEDWYIHPDLVDFKQEVKCNLDYKEILKILGYTDVNFVYNL